MFYQLYSLGTCESLLISRGDWGSDYSLSLPANGDLNTWFLCQQDGNPSVDECFPSLSKQVLNFPSQSIHHPVGYAKQERALQTTFDICTKMSEYTSDDLYNALYITPHELKAARLIEQPRSIANLKNERQTQVKHMIAAELLEYRSKFEYFTL